ncbi:MAG: Rieske 2Fe-2S domain-containing protein [Candidatus Thermoplasmatota archaeon]
MSTDVVLCPVSEIPDGAVKHFEIMGYDIAAANVGGSFFALDAMCTYQWADLTEGHVDKERMVLVCSQCKGSWDLKTGQPKDPPAQFPLTVYEIAAVGEDLILTFTY